MGKRVSADTITAITADPAFHGRQKAESPPPTSEQLIDRIRQELKDRTESARRKVEAGEPPAPGPYAVKPEVALARAQADAVEFEQILKEVPKGFQLVPVLYSRVDPDAKAKLTEEYQYHVRPRFLKFLAERHADELKALGISDLGIKRMKDGLDPTNEKGELYSVNIDHIIERNGSGVWGAEKEADPDQPGYKPKYHPNHFGNFILLPEKIHEFKNALNDIQHASQTPLGQNKWILMMTPERDAAHSGFVCQPQDTTHRLHGLDLRPTDDFKRSEHGEFIVGVTLNQIAELKEMGNFRQIVRGQILQADALKTKVADLAADQADGKQPGDLRKAFNDAVAKEPEAQAQLDNLVKPAIRDVTSYVRAAFDDLSKKTKTSKERAAFWAFARFFRSQPMRDLRQDIEALPFAEASEMHRGFNALGRDVTKVCDRLDAESKAKYAKETRESIPDFRRDVKQDNNPPGTKPAQPAKPPVPQGQPLPRRKPGTSARPRKPEEGREKRTFGRPGHFKNQRNG